MSVAAEAHSSAFQGLPSAARVVWAKHDRKTEGWLPLWRHMADSAAVAGELWERWVPRSVRGLVAEALPGGEEDALRLARFLAGVHDVGKATPAFACQVESLAVGMRDAGLDMLTMKEYGTDRRLAPHGLAGQLLLQEWLEERFGLAGRVSGQFAVVVGGHHGVPPEHQHIHDLQLRPHLLRHPGTAEQRWREVQFSLMDACAQAAGVTDRFERWAGVRLPQTAQVLLSSVVIVSDWIASAPELFPYDPESWQPAGAVGEQRRLRAAWVGLDLPGPWKPEVPQEPVSELFAVRFPKLRGFEVRPVQVEAVRAARAMPEPGLLVIEAPMGEGKTEAALAASEVLAARSGAGGVLVALPTRATSDAMFGRLTGWLDALPCEEDASLSVVLAHAKAALNGTWSGMLREGRRAITAVDPDGEAEGAAIGGRPAGLHAHAWLRGRKKQLLASFAVGTIDQVLFAGLKSRHLALRHLAVAGKVVIIDEVHAYDAYMSRYLERVLEWLAAYRVPVVLLSATLPAERRRALAAAYAGKSGAARIETDADAYPLVTAASPGCQTVSVRPQAASERRTEVVVERFDDDVRKLADRLAEELADGGCALVVRNTVARVLEAAEGLRERFGNEAVTVAHSRFLAADRAAKDADLVRRFGPGSDERPRRHVVVASQVVEQSLDVDFDLLVTDLAPVDLVLQRMGRLHRHPRSRPARLRQARCLITGVEDWQATPPLPVKGSQAVYEGDFTLLASLAVLGPYLDGAPLCLPTDISPLVQRAYGADLAVPQPWAQALEEARAVHTKMLDRKREAAEGFLLGPVRRAGRPVYGWLEAQAGDTDDTGEGRAQVRDTEESLEVLVVQRRTDGHLATVPWLPDDTEGPRGGLVLPTDFPPGRRAAEAVAASSLTLPPIFSKLWMIDPTIAELETVLIPAWQVKECPWLDGELLLVLDEKCQTHLSGFTLQYSPAEGLRCEPAAPSDTDPPADGGWVSLAGGGGDGGDGRSEQAENEGRGAEYVTAPRGWQGGVVTRERSAEDGPASFNLVSEPWLPVQRQDGSVGEVSLTGLFAEAGEIRRMVGDLPTQEIALLRLLLAIAYDALADVHGAAFPGTLEDWEELWLSGDPFAEVPAYLERHRDRFDLFHPEQPFYQVAGLRTGKDELAPLSRIVTDVPVGSVFFSMRRPGVDSIPYAEAARWLVHAHAFDTSGIKSALAGDEKRAKAGKVYPLGVGSLGNLGGIFAEGDSLRETLLLNLLAPDELDLVQDNAEDDRPVWRGPPSGAAPRDSGRPLGLRDLYTWQSRRLRLHPENGEVTGVVLGYGDPLALASPWKLEPMTAWRRSPTQEKKQQRGLVYMPKRHDPDKAAWRGLAALLPARQGTDERGKKGEAPLELRSGISRWFTQVITEGDVAPGKLVRLRLVGAVYGTQQSVVDEIVDDSVVLPVITLHEKNPVYGAAALDGVQWAEGAVIALGQLAANLARAAGSDPAPPSGAARDAGFGALDGPYRTWLRDLLSYPDLETARQAWKAIVRRHIARLGRELLASAGPAADEGRMAELPGLGPRWVDAGRANVWFAGRLNKVLGPAADKPRTDRFPDGPRKGDS
ncbi:type I-E CRISPR-associated protein Cse1/CasA [Streptomyces varsoviensis]|nr:type I-E CRISPR-associated protein Cse1/CasA [Streptomyces varsoviensis]